jgi:hypothetical protein
MTESRRTTHRTISRKTTVNDSDVIRALVAPLLDGIVCPPTDLGAVAKRLDVSISYERISGSGELRRVARGLQVICNATLPVTRSRFTIAHELGHALLERSGRGKHQRGRTTERFCDMVATELLMPGDVFRQDLREELSIPRLFQLRERYGTSLETTAYRCSEVGDVTVVEARAGQVARVRGPLRNFTGLDDEGLRDLIRRACDGVAGSARVYLRHNDSIRLWNVIHHPLQRCGHGLLLIDLVKE